MIWSGDGIHRGFYERGDERDRTRQDLHAAAHQGHEKDQELGQRVL